MSRKQTLDELMGKIGVGVAFAIFVGVNVFWAPIVDVLESLGWSDLSDLVGGKQRRLVAAVIAFAALVPLLILQAVLKRRQA
ncbi:MAG TPA: hypothetical protein DEA08_13475 [Planctomycetes bacterium]|nr:hypothetical protein [Planctomycetota bacterium]